MPSSHGLSESLEKEAELQVRLGGSADHQAATQAFVQQAGAGLPGPLTALDATRAER